MTSRPPHIVLDGFHQGRFHGKVGRRNQPQPSRILRIILIRPIEQHKPSIRKYNIIILLVSIIIVSCMGDRGGGVVGDGLERGIEVLRGMPM
eukprot:scaffold135122_cov54-Attheya_sp.AAC.3